MCRPHLQLKRVPAHLLLSAARATKVSEMRDAGLYRGRQQSPKRVCDSVTCGFTVRDKLGGASPAASILQDCNVRGASSTWQVPRLRSGGGGSSLPSPGVLLLGRSQARVALWMWRISSPGIPSAHTRFPSAVVRLATAPGG